LEFSSGGRVGFGWVRDDKARRRRSVTWYVRGAQATPPPARWPCLSCR
jgi:hypothetical protein